MQSSKVEIGAPIRAGGTTIVPVVKTSLSGWVGHRFVSFSAAKELATVIVISPSSRKAFRISGEEVPLDVLVREEPGIKDLLAHL